MQIQKGSLRSDVPKNRTLSLSGMCERCCNIVKHVGFSKVPAVGGFIGGLIGGHIYLKCSARVLGGTFEGS